MKNHPSPILFAISLLTIALLTIKPALSQEHPSVNSKSICKAVIAKTMGRSPAIIKIDSQNTNTVYLSYKRPNDGSVWSYKCSIKGNQAIWGNASGRWRNGPYDSKLSYAINKDHITIQETHSDGSNDNKTYAIQNLQ